MTDQNELEAVRAIYDTYQEAMPPNLLPEHLLQLGAFGAQWIKTKDPSVTSRSSFIIQRQIVWRDGDVLRSKPAYASVLNGTGCERVAYSEGETEAAFDARVDARASESD
ncbi:MAG: hypothetical protein ACJAVT_000272 [Yoonia sp.]